MKAAPIKIVAVSLATPRLGPAESVLIHSQQAIDNTNGPKNRVLAMAHSVTGVIQAEYNYRSYEAIDSEEVPTALLEPTA